MSPQVVGILRRSAERKNRGVLIKRRMAECSRNLWELSAEVWKGEIRGVFIKMVFCYLVLYGKPYLLMWMILYIWLIKSFVYLILY